MSEEMEAEAEIELCCEGLQQAIDGGAIWVLPQGSEYVEAVVCEDGKTAIRVNFCPFCGTPRSSDGLL